MIRVEEYRVRVETAQHSRDCALVNGLLRVDRIGSVLPHRRKHLDKALQSAVERLAARRRRTTTIMQEAEPNYLVNRSDACVSCRASASSIRRSSSAG